MCAWFEFSFGSWFIDPTPIAQLVSRTLFDRATSEPLCSFIRLYWHQRWCKSKKVRHFNRLSWSRSGIEFSFVHLASWLVILVLFASVLGTFSAAVLVCLAQTPLVWLFCCTQWHREGAVCKTWPYRNGRRRTHSAHINKSTCCEANGSNKVWVLC